MSVPAVSEPDLRPQGEADSAARSSVLDALRGLAIMFVVLSHSWRIWPEDRRVSLGPLDFLFSSGSTAVTAFFVVSGYLVTKAFVEYKEEFGLVGPLVWFIRRTLRLMIQVWLLLLAVLAVSSWDALDPWAPEVTRNSLIHAATAQWNTFVRDNALEARSDIGVLYFIAIDLQFFAAFLLVFLLIGRWRRALLAVVLVALLLASVWRYVAYENFGWFYATLTTTARVDALLWGVVAFLAAPALPRIGARASQYVGAALLILTGAFMANAFYGIGAYFGMLGVVTGCTTAVLVGADAQLRSRSSWADRLLDHPWLTALGRASLSIFLWHIPVFAWVRVHTSDWSPLLRTLVAVLLLVLIVIAAERLVARPLTRLVRGWGRLQPARVEEESPRQPWPDSSADARI